MVQKPTKKSSSMFPSVSNFSELDRVFDNFRREFEKSLYSFPRIEFSSFPKFSRSYM